MIVITGAAGFIGSCLASKLNRSGYTDLVLVDDFNPESKKRNWQKLQFREKVDRAHFFEWAKGKGNRIQFIFHIGARTNTTEADREILNTLNLEYSKSVWTLCVQEGIPLVYASSGATYGLGENGFSDDTSLLTNLKPLNLYGQSKQDFDLWVMEQKEKPFFWAGLKFFNVYGPNEYHKGRMASVIFHAVQQIRKEGELKLFRSHRKDIKDGEQKRDFIYVMDVLEVLIFLMHLRKNSGIYNLGSGEAHTFNELADSVFSAMHHSRKIIYTDTPPDIRDKYQYYTCADMSKLRSIGFEKPFVSLEAGIHSYIQEYLLEQHIY